MLQRIKPLRAFKGHDEDVDAVAVFPDGRHMVSGSADRTLRFWDLKAGVMLKKMEGHYDEVKALAVSQDGQLIASGDKSGDIIAWQGETRKSLTETIKAHSHAISSLDFSPDGTVLATASVSSADGIKFWSTEKWKAQGDPIHCQDKATYTYTFQKFLHCVRYSPSGEHLAIATNSDITIYNPHTRDCIASLKGHRGNNLSLAWMPDGTRLLSGGSYHDPNIREWDASTWQQVGDSWKDNTYMKCNHAMSINPTGTLVASLSLDNRHTIRVWQISDRRTVAILEWPLYCVTFSIDGRRILGGGVDKRILEFTILPRKDVSVKNASDEQTSKVLSSSASFTAPSSSNLISCKDALPKEIPGSETPQIFTMTTAVRNAFITGDLPTAEQLLTQDIDADPKNYASYTNRSFVMARLFDWDRALHDATMSVSTQPSFMGYISKGIALCGKQQVWDAMKAFDLAFTFADGDSKIAHHLFLIKAISCFNANKDEEGVFPVQELATRPNPDPLACRVVEAYMRVQLGTIAMDGGLHKEAADHFSAAVKAGASFAKLDIHSMYKEFVVLFGWDLKCLWQIANQKRCCALLRIGRFGTAFEAYRYMMDMSDEPTKAIFLAWAPALDESE